MIEQMNLIAETIFALRWQGSIKIFRRSACL